MTDTGDEPSIAGWDEFVDALRVLPAKALARLPAHLRSDRQTQQELGRRALASLAYAIIEAVGGDGDYPVFQAGTGQVLNIGQPNADSLYKQARVTPGGTYRIRGTLGNTRLASIGQLGPFPGEPGGEDLELPGNMSAYHDLYELTLDADRNFDVLLSPTRPEGYAGDWWQLNPGTHKLWLRLVIGDLEAERDGTIAIERVDMPAARSRRSADDLEDRLRRLPRTTTYFTTLLLEHVEELRQKGFVNRMTQFDVSGLMGLTGQFYFEGAYDLGDDEALIVETRVPKGTTYWSVIMTNEIFETIDWYNNHSALNDTQAAIDSDGVLRFVISAKDPGVPNWIATAGYPTGEFQGRWYGAEDPVIPEMRKVSLSELRAHLPADTPLVTPEQRDALIRQRRLRLQQRILW